ncbi:MAG: chromate transporter [Bacteroidales bacterium]|nr:chromate transporter [Bacteroidales bacterium]
MAALFLQLFCTFFLIGMFTFGGGYAVIGVIQNEIVTMKGWISESAFTDIVAISQMTPGPVGLNCSTYVGYEVMKEAGAGELIAGLGSLTASIAVVLPSFLIMLAIVKFYSRFRQTPMFNSVMSGLRPAVAGLIGAAAVVLAISFDGGKVFIIRENFPDWKSWLVFGGAFGLSFIKKISPVWLIFGAGLVGLLIYR